MMQLYQNRKTKRALIDEYDLMPSPLGSSDYRLFMLLFISICYTYEDKQSFLYTNTVRMNTTEEKEVELYA